MKKIKLLLATAALMLGGSVWAQTWTDVTSYITNASLVADYYTSNNDTWWPVYTTGRTGNKHHPKNWYLHTNGTTNHNINTETGFFECWTANQGVKRWTLFQDVTLPAGTYRLTGQYSTNESRGIIKTVAITPHHSYYSTGITSSNWGSWGSETAEFTIYEETKVRVGMISTNFAQNHGFTLETTGAKQLLADEIAAAPAGVNTTAAQSVYDDGGSDDAAYRSAAKTLHDAIVAYNIANASAGSPVDMTDYITDPSFEGIANATAYTGNKHGLMSVWSSPSVTDGGARSLTGNDYLITDNSEDGFYAVNLWNSSSTTYYVQQTISGLPVGRYVLTATYASDASNTATLSMASAESTITATNKGNFVEGSVTYNHTAEGDVIIKLNSSSWFKADNFKLSYQGDPLKAVKAELSALKATIDDDYLNNSTYNNVVGTERTALTDAKSATAAEETVEAYETAISNVQAAIDAFVAAMPAYDALVTEIAYAKTLSVSTTTAEAAKNSEASAASVTAAAQALKVLEYSTLNTTYPIAVTEALGEWPKGNYDTTSGEGYNGSETYFDKWSGSATDLSSSKTVALPEGKYVVRVAGRGLSTTTMNLSVKVGDADAISTPFLMIGNTGKGIDTSGATNFDDGGTYSNSNNGRGWQYRYITFTTSGEDVTITINGHLDAGTWQSFYAPVLFCDNDTKNAAELAAAKAGLLAAITAATSARKSENEGTGVFQIPTAAGETLASAISTAQGVYDNGEASLSAVNDATTAMSAAQTTYEGATLNAPAAGDVFNVMITTGDDYAFKDKPLTFNADNASGAYFDKNVGVQAHRAQQVTFTYVSGNQYKLSMINVNGDEVFIGTNKTINNSGNYNQIRLTIDGEKALAVEVIPTTTAGVFNLKNTEANALLGCQDDPATRDKGGIFTVGVHNDFTITAATKPSVEVIVAAGKLATRIFPFKPTLPTGVAAYSCSANTGTSLTLVEVAEPAANVPYILYSESGCSSTYLEGWGTASADTYTEGYLTGVFTRTEVPQNSYVLQTPTTGENEGKQAFYKVNQAGAYSSAYRVYVTVPAAGVKSFGFTLDDMQTAIEAARAEGENTVTLRYNVAGQQMQNEHKGLNIIKMADGSVRKVLVK